MQALAEQDIESIDVLEVGVGGRDLPLLGQPAMLAWIRDVHPASEDGNRGTVGTKTAAMR